MRDLILVVDNNRDSADLLIRLIRKLGYDARAIYDGSEAIRQTAIHAPDMLLIDLKMPGDDGFTVASSIRRQPGGDDVLLVALTALAGEDAQRLAYAAGFDLYLTTPTTVNELARVLNLLRPLTVREATLV